MINEKLTHVDPGVYQAPRPALRMIPESKDDKEEAVRSVGARTRSIASKTQRVDESQVSSNLASEELTSGPAEGSYFDPLSPVVPTENRSDMLQSGEVVEASGTVPASEVNPQNRTLDESERLRLLQELEAQQQIEEWMIAQGATFGMSNILASGSGQTAVEGALTNVAENEPLQSALPKVTESDVAPEAPDPTSIVVPVPNFMLPNKPDPNVVAQFAQSQNQ